MVAKLRRAWYYLDEQYAYWQYRFLKSQKWACRFGWHQRAYTRYDDRTHPIYDFDPDAMVLREECFRCDYRGGLHIW